MVHSGLGESQPALPPNDASEFLNEVLFGWALRVMLGRKRRDDRGVLGPILPWQDGVAGEDPVPKRIEARELGSAWPRAALIRHQKLPFLFCLVRSKSFVAQASKAPSAMSSASSACSR